MQHPLCELCYQKDIIKEASDVHHIISPFSSEQGKQNPLYYAYDADNLISLCKECHSELHGNKLEETLYNIYYERKNKQGTAVKENTADNEMQ